MLDPQTINELARQIATQQIVVSWTYWLLLFALIFLVSAAGTWLAAYFKIRGENFAKKADFDQLLEELQRQTEATERIRAIVEHTTWLTQEWNRMRRLKLEEYLEEVTALDHRLDKTDYEYLYGDTLIDPKPSPTAKADMLQTLYFPELEAEHVALMNAARERKRAAIQIRQDRIALVTPALPLAAAVPPAASTAVYTATFAPLLGAVDRLKARCQALMHALANPDAED